MNQKQLFELDKLPDKEIIRTLNKHHDFMEALLNRVLQLEGEVARLKNGKDNF